MEHHVVVLAATKQCLYRLCIFLVLSWACAACSSIPRTDHDKASNNDIAIITRSNLTDFIDVNSLGPAFRQQIVKSVTSNIQHVGNMTRQDVHLAASDCGAALAYYTFNDNNNYNGVRDMYISTNWTSSDPPLRISVQPGSEIVDFRRFFLVTSFGQSRQVYDTRSGTLLDVFPDRSQVLLSDTTLYAVWQKHPRSWKIYSNDAVAENAANRYVGSILVDRIYVEYVWMRGATTFAGLIKNNDKSEIVIWSFTGELLATCQLAWRVFEMIPIHGNKLLLKGQASSDPWFVVTLEGDANSGFRMTVHPLELPVWTTSVSPSGVFALGWTSRPIPFTGVRRRIVRTDLAPRGHPLPTSNRITGTWLTYPIHPFSISDVKLDQN